MQPFHLAIPVIDLEKCRQFYRDVLDCPEGRSDTHWVDFDFLGINLSFIKNQKVNLRKKK
jgi:extradiol dioxygenase family protein